MEGTTIPIGDNEVATIAWAKTDKDSKHVPIHIPRGVVGDNHVKFDLLFCGICHSDCHAGNNDWGGCKYPFVGGHELFGKVSEVGKSVTRCKVGDLVGVGCIVDSCSDCKSCNKGCENYCYKGMTGTYGGNRQHGKVPGNAALPTYGGYSAAHVVDENYILNVPEGIPHEAVGPILCAGITMYSPLKHFDNGEGKMTVGIVGIGGLGTMGIKLAAAMGHEVIAISTSDKKEALAKEKGASGFVVSKDPESIKKFAQRCDLILNTVSAAHDLNTYLPLLAKDGTLVQLGGILVPHQVSQLPLMFNRQRIAGSLIGGIKET
jgi:uncharacterized zinc-type alcohol dehydrogenase-like protein